MEATKTGRLDVAEALLAGGARADARDRAAGTALDVAEREGREALATLLRRHGARGSGKSVGDRVCVRPGKGSGFCGTVAAIEGTSYLLDVTSVAGCEGGCPADAECSASRPVGGMSAEAVRAGTSVRTKSWCLTHTGLD
jgi:ankyrin repeat protein